MAASSAIRPYLDAISRSTVPVLGRGVMMVAEASKPGPDRSGDPGRAPRPPWDRGARPLDLNCPLLRLRLDDLVELQLAVHDLVQTVIRQRGVTVRVDRVRA